MKTNATVKCATVLAIAALPLLPLSSLGATPDANWTKHCAACHGKDGTGNTKAGQKAGVKDLTDAKYQGEFTDEQALKSVKEGLKTDGKEKMKPFGSKLTDDEIKALIAKIRGMKK